MKIRRCRKKKHAIQTAIVEAIKPKTQNDKLNYT